MKSSQTNFQAVSSIKSTQKCTDILGPPTAQVVLLSHSTRPLPGPEHPLTEPGPSRVLSAPLTEPGTSGVLSAPSLNQGPSRVLSAPSLNQAPPGSGRPCPALLEEEAALQGTGASPYQEAQVHPPQQGALAAVGAPNGALKQGSDPVRQADLGKGGVDLSAVHPARQRLM